MFLDSLVLRYTMIGFLAFGTLAMLGIIGFGFKRLFITIRNKNSANSKTRNFGLGIVDDIKSRVERNESNADIIFHVSISIFLLFGLIIAIAFWIEKLIQLIF